MTDAWLAGAGVVSPRTAGVEAAGEQSHPIPERAAGQDPARVFRLPRRGDPEHVALLINRIAALLDEIDQARAFARADL